MQKQLDIIFNLIFPFNNPFLKPKLLKNNKNLRICKMATKKYTIYNFVLTVQGFSMLKYTNLRWKIISFSSQIFSNFPNLHIFIIF